MTKSIELLHAELDQIIKSNKFETIVTEEETPFRSGYVSSVKLGTQLVFLIIDAPEKDFTNTTLQENAAACHLWSLNHLEGFDDLAQVGLNLIYIVKNHESAPPNKTSINLNEIRDVNAFAQLAIRSNQIGMLSHAAKDSIIQSITVVNSNDYSFLQKKTWVVLGKVRKVLKDMKTHLEGNSRLN